MLIKLEHADRALWLPGDRERRLVGLYGVDLTYISVRPLNGCRVAVHREHPRWASPHEIVGRSYVAGSPLGQDSDWITGAANGC